MVLRNVVEVNEEKLLFQLFFLKDDEYQSVEVEEVEEIDFREVKKRLKQGESVFITRKRKQELKMSLVAREDVAELCGLLTSKEGARVRNQAKRRWACLRVPAFSQILVDSPFSLETYETRQETHKNAGCARVYFAKN